MNTKYKYSLNQNSVVKHILLFILFGLFSSGIYSQEEQECRINLNKEYIFSYWNDGWDAALAPLHWDRNEWITFSAISVVGTYVYFNDEKIFDFFHDNQNDFSIGLSKYIAEPFGNPFITLPIAGSFYLYSLIAKDYKSERTGLIGIEALLINGAITLTAKYILNRQRPSASQYEDPYKWYGPFGHEYHGAFPSGHTSSAFTLATVIAQSYKDVWWVPYTVYTLATLTALSRIHDARHWPSDVVFGAALGFGVGKLVYRRKCEIEKMK